MKYQNIKNQQEIEFEILDDKVRFVIITDENGKQIKDESSLLIYERHRNYIVCNPYQFKSIFHPAGNLLEISGFEDHKIRFFRIIS